MGGEQAVTCEAKLGLLQLLASLLLLLLALDGLPPSPFDG